MGSGGGARLRVMATDAVMRSAGDYASVHNGREAVKGAGQAALEGGVGGGWRRRALIRSAGDYASVQNGRDAVKGVKGAGQAALEGGA